MALYIELSIVLCVKRHIKVFMDEAEAGEANAQRSSRSKESSATGGRVLQARQKDQWRTVTSMREWREHNSFVFGDISRLGGSVGVFM